MSASDDGFIVVWDMKAKRLESPQWKESDWCEFCKKPFFWNVKAMWESKIVGKRQHHCRRCGAAGCDECTREKVQLPILGHEFPVRVCNNCASSVKDDEYIKLYISKSKLFSNPFSILKESLVGNVSWSQTRSFMYELWWTKTVSFNSWFWPLN